jgi:hypothetical protein
LTTSNSTSTSADLQVYSGETLQQLIDQHAAAGHKQVSIPAGLYMLRDAIRLRSGLHLIGQGQVILQTQPIVSSPLLDIVGYGHSEFRVADPQYFDTGQGVTITAENKGGFGITVASIVSRQGDTFFTDTPYYADYWPNNKGVVLTAYPAVVGRDVRDIVLENVTLQGTHHPDNPWVLNGCRNAGIYLIGCANIHFKQVEIHQYPGDALSFQQCVDIYVQSCHLHHNAGHGLHPGSGTVRYVLADNHIHHNGDCGIYYCLRTTHSICRDNRIESNVNHGITVGERDTHHLIENNIIGSNGKAGLIFRKPVHESGNHVIVKNNHFTGATSTRAAIEVQAGLQDVHLIANTFDASLPAPVIRISTDCETLICRDNLQAGKPLAAHDIESESALITAADHPLPEVSPAHVEPHGGRHLRIHTLDPWIDRTLA